MQIKRHTNWSKVGDRVKNWHKLAVDGSHEPDIIIMWVEENLTGEWTTRSLTDEEVITIFGRPPAGSFVHEYAFAERADYDRFRLNFGDHAGKA